MVVPDLYRGNPWSQSKEKGADTTKTEAREVCHSILNIEFTTIPE